MKQEAQAQVAEGVDTIDIHVALASIDEQAGLAQAVEVVGATTGSPIRIDTACASAREAALRVCPGKSLANSVTGEDSSLRSVLPLVKRYGAAVIGLAMD